MSSRTGKRFRNFLFDLDGTLVDSAGDILDCLNRAFGSVTGRTGLSVEREYIGFPVREIAAKALPGATQRQIEDMNSEFRRLYDSSDYNATRLYPGTKSTLDSLTAEGCALFIVTNKPIKPASAILRKFGLNLFSEVVCPDVLEGRRMAKDEMISYLLEKRGLDKAETLFVGDAEPDVLAARANGVPVAAALYGYGDREKLRALAPEYLLEDIAALRRMLEL